MRTSPPRTPRQRRRLDRLRLFAALPLLGLLLAVLLCGAGTATAAPQLVVSIAPLHSLVSAVTSGVSEPLLLLPQGGSPHSGSLRPSQARALARADLFVWIGPQLEGFLERSVSNLVRDGAELRLLAQPRLHLLPQRSGGFWAEHGEGESHAENEGHDGDEEDGELGEAHDPSAVNPHLWLAPRNAATIAALVAERLSALDPQHRQRYAANLANLQQRIGALERRLKEELQPLRERPYLVFHDAYPYFEEAFDLNAVGSIRISADRAPGARRLQQIEAKIEQSAAVCLFSEPQFSPALARRLAEGNALRRGVLDPLGSPLAPDGGGWFGLMEDLARNLTDCLGATP